MKKTVCMILFTMSVNIYSVDVDDRRLLPYSPPAPFFVTPVSNVGPDSGDETENSSERRNSNNISHSCVTFNLDTHGERVFIPRTPSPLPPLLPRSGSCCFVSSEKNENYDINSPVPRFSNSLQNEILCSSPSKNKLPKSPSSYDIPNSYLFEETRYRVMKWTPFQKMVREAKEQFFSSKSLSSKSNIPHPLTVLIMRHAKDTVGLDKVHGPQDVCENIYISGNEYDDFKRFYTHNQNFNWVLCSSEDVRNQMTLRELFPNCEPISDPDLNETYVPEFTGIPKKRIASHADCRKMLQDPTYKTPSAPESVDGTAARVLNKLSALGKEFKNKKIVFCSNSFAMNSIISLFNEDKKLIKIGNLDFILIRMYGDYITAFTDQEGEVKVFTPRELSSIPDILYPPLQSL